MKRVSVIIAIAVAIATLGVGGVYAAGQIAKNNSISEDHARNFAYVDAGVLPEECSDIRTKFDFEKGRFVYEVEFTAGDLRYEYLIDSHSGLILKKTMELIRIASVQNLNPAEESSRTVPETRPADGETTEDRRPTQSLVEETTAEVPETQPSVEETTEKVLETQPLVEETTIVTAPATQPAAETTTAAPTQPAVPETTPVPPTQPAVPETTPAVPATTASPRTISMEEAKSIALKRAGLSAGDVVFTKAKQDYEDGRLVYEIEFYKKDYSAEYELDIDAYSGAVLKYEIEEKGKQPQASTASPGTQPQGISLEDAKRIALSRAGKAAAGVIFTKAKQDFEDGRRVYEIEFYVPGGMEYEYEIDAVDGTILEEDTEPWDD